MPRRARSYSHSGIYHVIIRGINRFDLFDEPEDYCRFLDYLKRYAESMNVSIHAYCLMSNHVHLLLFSPAEQLPSFMKKLQVSYAAYYNLKNERCGHLFQDRYKSEKVESVSYLLSVLRYILNNPVNAGIGTLETYPWSSFSSYANPDGFVDCTIFQAYLRDYDEYCSYLNEKNQENIMEYDSFRFKKDDAWANRLAAGLFGESWRNEFVRMKKEQKECIVQRLYDAGVSLRQMSRLTGVGRAELSRLLNR